MSVEAPTFSDLGIRVVENVTPVDNIVRFEIFRDLPVVSAYSWGNVPELDGAANMSVSAKFPDAEHAEPRAIQFLALNGIDYQNTINIVPKYPIDPFSEQIYHAFPTTINDQRSENGWAETHLNAIWTRERGIGLGVKPADCPSVVAFGVDVNNYPVGMLIHLSYHTVDMNLAHDAISYMDSHLGVDPSTAHVAVSPSIFIDNYSFPMKDAGLIKNPRHWHDQLEQRGERLHLDLQAAMVNQLLAAGVRPENIEVHRIDTFEAARRREGHSDRYAKSMRDADPEYKPGRFYFVTMLT